MANKETSIEQYKDAIEEYLKELEEYRKKRERERPNSIPLDDKKKENLKELAPLNFASFRN